MEVAFMQIVNPFQKIMCPFCGEDFHLRDCNVVSITTGNILHDAQGTQPPLWSRLIVPGLIGKKKTRDLASYECPNPQCKKLLPRNIGMVDDNITIAVIGDTFSGKSHYIAATIDQLRKGRYTPRDYNLCLLNPADDEVEDRYQRQYYQPLFQNKQVLPFTQTAFDQMTEPLIYELTLDGPTRKQINLLIYDVNGEDLMNKTQLVRYRPHLLNAKAILFLADPWGMKGFRDKLAHHLQPEASTVTGRVTANVLHAVINLYQNHLGRTGRQSFPLPVAITISKADLTPYLRIDPSYHSLYSPAHADQMDFDNNSPIDESLRKLLEELDEHALLRLVETLDRARFFATSATGVSADTNGQYPSIEPYRCLDPVFWILRELRLID
jgi:hypothetical protein